MDESLDDIYKYIFGHIMTQMTATAGIKKHGQAAVDALLQEFCQLDRRFWHGCFQGSANAGKEIPVHR